MGAEKRQARGFEPPPWEREQFEELERQRAARESEEQAAAVAEPAAGGEASAEPETEPETTEPETVAAPAETPAATADSTGGPSKEDTVDEAKMSEMLAGLRVEEPKNPSFHWLGIAMAGFLALVGAVMMIWGIVALQATQGKGTLGWLGAAGTIFFGAGFIAIAGWVVYKNLQRQGVL